MRFQSGVSTKRMGRFSIRLLLLFLIAFPSACSKEDATVGNEQAEAVLVETLPNPAKISLDELVISFREGIPVYKNTDAFLQAKQAVNNSSHRDYLNWANTNGLRSLYVKYDDLARTVEAQPAIKSASLIDFSKEPFFYSEEEGGVFLKPTIPFVRLLDDQARMFIGEDLHAFTDELHFILDNGTRAQLEELQKNPIHDPENGIILEYAISDQQVGEKIAYDLVGCPHNFVDNFDPVLQVPEDIQIIRNPDWSPGNYQALRHIYDEQRVGGNRRRHRQGTKGYLIGFSMISEINPSSYRIISSLEHKYENRKRQGLNWIRTFPNVRFERDPLRFPLSVEYSSGGIFGTVPGAGNPTLPLYSFTEEVAYPATEEEITAHDGSAHGEWTLTQKNLVLYSRELRPSNLYLLLKFLDGRTRHRWSNRGEDPINDPIAATFGCSN